MKSTIHSSGRQNVGMFEWAAGKNTAILEAKELGPCVGIATFCPTNKIGHLAHIPNPDLRPDLVDEFLTSVEDNAAEISDVTVWVRGGTPNRKYDEILTDPVIVRNFVEDKIIELGLVWRNVDIVWSEAFEVVDLKLDCLSGIFTSKSNEPRYRA